MEELVDFAGEFSGKTEEELFDVQLEYALRDDKMNV